jgi:hypothetical protein
MVSVFASAKWILNLPQSCIGSYSISLVQWYHSMNWIFWNRFVVQVSMLNNSFRIVVLGAIQNLSMLHIRLGQFLTDA